MLRHKQRDTTIEAKYADGFTYTEYKHQDVAQFDESPVKHNVFYDVLNRLPEPKHGRMVRFSVYWNKKWHHIDWTKLPYNARPIRFRHAKHVWDDKGRDEFSWTGVQFGYQYTDEYGNNVQSVEEL